MKRRFPKWPKFIPKNHPVFKIYKGPTKKKKKKKKIALANGDTLEVHLEFVQ